MGFGGRRGICRRPSAPGAGEPARFDLDLIARYDQSGPRYTSYPTAVQFTDAFGEQQYRETALASNASGNPLSLYFHIPFCDTVCFYCACNKVVTKDRSRAGPYLQRLHRELALQAELFDHSRPVTQLHWGGGTPTFISHDEMRALMAETRRHFQLAGDDQGELLDAREIDRVVGRPVDLEADLERLAAGVVHEAGAEQEVAESLVGLAFSRIASQQPIERLEDAGFVHVLFHQPVETAQDPAVWQGQPRQIPGAGCSGLKGRARDGYGVAAEHGAHERISAGWSATTRIVPVAADDEDGLALHLAVRVATSPAQLNLPRGLAHDRRWVVVDMLRR